MKRLELKGKTFGYLTVLEFSHIDQTLRHTMWKCLCICGVTTIARGSHLTMGFSTSCGCKKRLRGLDNPRSTGFGEIPGHRWAQIIGSARRRKIAFTVNLEQAWTLFLKQRRKCALSGVSITFGASGLSHKDRSAAMTASLDRVDSDLGYTLSNVQWVHKDLNIMKWSKSDEEFFKWCELVVAYQRELKPIL